MCISRHTKKEKSYLLIISQACKISWWYILRFYVCITWLSTILAVVIGDENILKIETRLPNFKNIVLGGKPTSQKQQKNQKKAHRTNIRSSSCQYTVLQCLYYTVLPCLLSFFWNESWFTICLKSENFFHSHKNWILRSQNAYHSLNKRCMQIRGKLPYS